MYAGAPTRRATSHASERPYLRNSPAQRAALIGRIDRASPESVERNQDSPGRLCFPQCVSPGSTRSVRTLSRAAARNRWPIARIHESAETALGRWTGISMPEARSEKVSPRLSSSVFTFKNLLSPDDQPYGCCEAHPAFAGWRANDESIPKFAGMFLLSHIRRWRSGSAYPSAAPIAATRRIKRTVEATMPRLHCRPWGARAPKRGAYRSTPKPTPAELSPLLNAPPMLKEA